MGEKVIFDSTIKTIIVTEAPYFDGTDWVVDLDIKVDVFSDGKEDWIDDDLLNKFRFPVTTAGGDDITADQKLGSTFFLEYDWKIRPYEASHVLKVNGNIYTRNETSPFSQTLGSFNVMVINTVSNLLDSTIQQLSEIEFATFQNAVWVKEGSGNHVGDFSLVGNREYPVETISDAVMIANGRGLGRIGLLSEYVLGLGENITGFEVFGENPIKTVFFLGSDGVVGNGTVIKDCFVGGVIDDDVIVRECIVSGLDWISGYLYDSVIFGGVINVINGATAYIYDCKAGAYGTGTPTFDLGGSGQSLEVQGYGGILKIQNKDGSDVVSCNVGDGANIVLADDVTAGTVYVRGNALLSDEAGEYIPSGSWNGGVAIVNQANDPNNITHTVINYDMTGYNEHCTFGAIQVRDAYNGVIYIDMYNESGNAGPGDEFPSGLLHKPVNNIPDLLSLLERFHFSRARVIGDLDVPSGTNNINGITFCSSNTIDRTLSIPDGVKTRGTQFHDMIVTGILDGRTYFLNCDLKDVYGFYGDITDSTIAGILDFDDSKGVTSVIKDCSAGGDGITPTLHIKDAKISMIDWTGWINFAEKTGSSILGASVSSGVIEVQNTCTAGLIILAGIGTAIDNSDVGCIVSTSHLLNTTNITDAVWDDPDAIQLVSDTRFVRDVEGGKWQVVNDQMVFYEDDNTTEIMRFNLFDENGNPASENVFKRERL